MKNAHDVIIRPIITEASMDKIADKVYTFEVAKSASKPEIKAAVEEIFKVNVEAVNVINMKSKPKRVGYHMGATSEWKKAIVKLTAESTTIEFFDSMMA